MVPPPLSSSSSRGIFVRHNVEFSTKGFNPKSAITQLRVQNEVMLVACSGHSLQHVRLQNDKCSNIDLSLSAVDRIAYIHLDYSGTHAIVSSTAGENFYVHMKTLAVKPLRRLKGMVISAVGWNLDYGKDSETAFILLGTTKGSILETNITSSGNMNYVKSLTSNLSQDNKELAITDLHLHQCSEDENDRFFLLVCMPGRLYALCETANLSAAAQQTYTQPALVGTVWSGVMVEQPQGAVLQSLFNFNEGRPRCHSQSEEKAMLPSALVVYPIGLNETPNKYCWLSAEGLSIGRIDMTKEVSSLVAGAKRESAQSDAFDMIVEEAHIKHRRVEGRFDYPLDIALTEYHVVLLYSTRIVAISLLDQSVAFEENLPASSTVVGMARDISSQFIWVFTEKALFKYRPFDETRYIWRIYLDRKEFGKARKITSQMLHEDPAPYQMVIKKEAEKFIADKNYEAAAELLAQSTEPFEAITLKFLKDGSASRNGLKRYLELKLNKMQRVEDNVKRDILVIWLLEIQLGELAELRRNRSSSSSKTESKVGEGTSEGSKTSIHQKELAGTLTVREAEVKKLREELYCFLNRAVVSESVNDNRSAVYRMISSHVDFETQLYLANKLKDFDVVIKILLLQRNYKQALEVIVQQAVPSFFYKYSPELIAEIPTELVQALIENRRILQPNQLLPVFYKCFDGGTSGRVDEKLLAASFKYLDHVVSRPGPRVDPALHNFVIHLHATFKPTTLLDYLSRFGKKRSKLPYDVEYALRICVEKKLTECCIFLYCIEGLFETAVKLALTISLDLAKECAQELSRLLERSDESNFLLDLASGNGSDVDGSTIFDDLDDEDEAMRSKVTEESRRQVWLEIARKMIADKEEDIEACLALLKESKGVIKIQDIMPFFSEFTRIEHFKEPLCACLKEHSNKIQELQKEMKEASEMAEEINAEVEKNKAKSMVIKTSDKCCKCKDILLTQPFFAFTCRHFFHKDCLERHMIKEKFSKVETEHYHKLCKNEKLLKKRVEMMKVDGKTKEQAIAEWKAAEKEVKELLAEDCPMCGMRIVNSINRPFFTNEEYKEELALWSFT